MGHGRGPWAHMPRRPKPCGITRRPHPLPCHLSMGWPPHCFSSVDPRRFDPNVHIELPWIHGPTVIQLEGPNRPPNYHSNHGNRPTYHATASKGQPSPLDGKAMQGTVDRRPLGQPMPPATPLPLLHLQVPPYPLHTIKGAVVLGGDHHSIIPSSSEALQSSSLEVVAS